MEMSGGLGSGDGASTATQQPGPQQRLPRGPPEAHNAVGDVHPSPAGQPTDNGTAHPSCGELGSRENPSLGTRTTTEWVGKDGSGGHIVIMGGGIRDSPRHLPPVESTLISTTYCHMRLLRLVVLNERQERPDETLYDIVKDFVSYTLQNLSK